MWPTILTIASRCPGVSDLSKASTAQSISPPENSAPRSPYTQNLAPSSLVAPKLPFLTMKALLERQKCSMWPSCPAIEWPAGLVLKEHWQNIGHAQAAMIVAFMLHSGGDAILSAVAAAAANRATRTSAIEVFIVRSSWLREVPWGATGE